MFDFVAALSAMIFLDLNPRYYYS